MDLYDLLSGGSQYIKVNKPRCPDMDRISEIVLQMKAATSSASSFEQHEANWRTEIEAVVDYDALAWQAINVGFDVFGIKTAADLLELRRSRKRNEQFIGCVQAFYDGFLLGAKFEQRGGHRDAVTEPS